MRKKTDDCSSNLVVVAREAGSVAGLAAARKSARCNNLDTGFTFQTTAIETLGTRVTREFQTAVRVGYQTNG